MNKLYFIFIIFIATNKALAIDDYCNKLDLGWNFYCDPEILEEESSEKPLEIIPEIKIKSYAEKLEKLHEEQKELNAKRVLNPTKENILAYEKMKKEMLGRAAYLTQLTKRVQWQNAELNYELTRPISAMGKKIWIEERQKNIRSTMENLSKQYGFIFFFSSTCPYCHKYAPIIKRVAQSYNIEILAISLDGICMAEFPNCRIDNGEGNIMGVEAVPTTLLFNKSLAKAEIIGTGLLSVSELEERIYRILEIEVGDDY